MKLGVARGVAFSLCMLYGGLACCFITFPSLVLMLVPSRYITRLRRRYNTFILGHFSRFAGLLIRALFGTRVFVYCNDKKILDEDHNKVLISSNHRTRIDWMFIIWIYGSVIRKISDMVVFLKDDLKKLPVIGWCMQVFLYVFLERNRERDVPHIQRMLQYIVSIPPVHSVGHRLTSLLIFPEGTDLSDNNLAKSKLYSSEKGLPERKFVLHPKSQGLITAIECFRERDDHVQSLEGSVLHDLTLAYEDSKSGARPSERDLFTGEFPLAVHIHVERHDLRYLPPSKEGLSQWVQDSFVRKEALLDEFYTSISRAQEDAGAAEPCRLASWPPLQSHPLSSTQCSFAHRNLPILIMSFLCACVTRVGFIFADTFPYIVFAFALLNTVCLFIPRIGGIDDVELKLHGNSALFSAGKRQ